MTSQSSQCPNTALPLSPRNIIWSRTSINAAIYSDSEHLWTGILRQRDVECLRGGRLWMPRRTSRHCHVPQRLQSWRMADLADRACETSCERKQSSQKDLSRRNGLSHLYVSPLRGSTEDQRHFSICRSIHWMCTVTGPLAMLCTRPCPSCWVTTALQKIPGEPTTQLGGSGGKAALATLRESSAGCC